MDDLVIHAMAKWPNVPHVYGWLALDRRGHWLIKGERISNPLVTEFINRNYECDPRGRWYFQNGPQRVFVALDYLPFVYRAHTSIEPGSALEVRTHTGKPVARIEGAWIDESGIAVLMTEYGPGTLDDRDLEQLLHGFADAHGAKLSDDEIGGALEQLQSGAPAPLWFHYRSQNVRVQPIAAATLAQTFHVDPRPAAAAD